MSKYKPFDFQEEAIDKLTEKFVYLWESTSRQCNLVFKAPTGSGKTFMVTHFVHSLNSLPNWDYDKAFIWITFSDSLAMQSKEKFTEYFSNNLKNNLLTIEDFKQGRLEKNDVLFINWQKLVSKSAENRVLRRPDDENFLKEQGYYFEDIIDNTKKNNREIVMIVDESHTHLSELAQRSVIDIVDPKIIINISATPRYIPNQEEEEEGIAAFVSVKRDDVIKAGLIKEKIVVQTEEDLKMKSGEDLDELLIDLAIQRKNKVTSEFKELGKSINPLILIQLPNDDNKLLNTGEKTKEQIVLEYLSKKNVDIDNKVALWFDGKQVNMDFISNNESDIDFMLFKQAAGTGWDCPRAHILVMYREISSAVFYTQTLGRILRFVDPNNKRDYNSYPNLRTGFLFTNYKRNEIGIPDQTAKNKPYIFTSYRKDDIINIDGVYSDFVSRIDYGDLGNALEFQKCFTKSLSDFFDIDQCDFVDKIREKIENKGVNLSPKLTNKIIVDAEISDYDKINLDIENSGHDEEYEISRNDIERLFNFWCYRILVEQTENCTKVSNVARSWGPLKSALRVWFKSMLGIDSIDYYKIFIADINKEQSSVFRKAISYALKEYYPIRKSFLEKRKKSIEAKEKIKFEIKPEYSYNDDFETLPEEQYSSRLSVVQPFYIRKDYKGRINEIQFIKYLESKADIIDWWFKNGENSKEYFCLKYIKKNDNTEALFYPDWIVRFKSGKLGIFDTKSGFTAIDQNGRAEGLYNKLIELQDAGIQCIGGLVILENNQWYCSVRLPYKYTIGNLTDNWTPLETLLKE